MLNFFAKFLLLSTSLSPVLVGVAISEFNCEQILENFFPLLLIFIAIMLALLCLCIMKYAERTGQCHPVDLASIERKDQEMLTFLFLYLLPLVRSEHSMFTENWVLSLYVLVVIFVALSYAEAFHFNPVMRILQYRFYSVSDTNGMPFLLISKREIGRTRKRIRVIEVTPYIYLYTGDPDAS